MRELLADEFEVVIGMALMLVLMLALMLVLMLMFVLMLMQVLALYRSSIDIQGRRQRP